MREPSSWEPESVDSVEMRQCSSGASTPLNKWPSPGGGGQCAAESLEVHKCIWDPRPLSE